jgi:hypothetical protein
MVSQAHTINMTTDNKEMIPLPLRIACSQCARVRLPVLLLHLTR